MSRIEDFECQADRCEATAAEIVVTDDDHVVLLCTSHYAADAPHVAVTTLGETLMRDTAGTWFFLPGAHGRRSARRDAVRDGE